MSPTLPPELVADLLGRCARCPNARELDSDHCAICDAKLKGYKRTYAAKRRATRKQRGLCKDCGRRSKLSRCRQCERRQSPRVEHPTERVDQKVPISPKRGHYKTEVFADGAERTRYVGQSHRGGPTRVEQDASLVKLVLAGLARGSQFSEEFPACRPRIDALPRIQRAETWKRLAYESLTYPARMWLEAAKALGDPVAAAMLAALEDAGGDE